jgi:ABC-type antimicrobial peptide transport system permease subunit
MAVPASNSRTLDQLIGASLAPRQFALWLTGSLAGIALLLALVGIYGVLSCMVNELAVDIGLRLALGAQRSQVLRMVLWQGMCAVIVGGAVGLAGACAFTRLLRRLLYEVSPTDPLTLLLTASLLVVAALAACWLPARRAASVDPMETLRCE